MKNYKNLTLGLMFALSAFMLSACPEKATVKEESAPAQTEQVQEENNSIEGAIDEATDAVEEGAEQVEDAVDSTVNE